MDHGQPKQDGWISGEYIERMPMPKQTMDELWEEWKANQPEPKQETWRDRPPML